MIRIWCTRVWYGCHRVRIDIAVGPGGTRLHVLLVGRKYMSTIEVWWHGRHLLMWASIWSMVSCMHHRGVMTLHRHHPMWRWTSVIRVVEVRMSMWEMGWWRHMMIARWAWLVIIRGSH